MDSSLLKQFNLVLNREKAKLNKRLAIFIFFLIISTILWFLIKLSHEYTTELSYPVQLVNLPKGKVIVGNPPRTIQLRVRAYGYTLLRYKLIALLSPIQVNIKGAKKFDIDNTTDYYILTSGMSGSIVSQLNEDISVLGILPDTLSFQMAGVVDKIVKVKPDLNVSYAKQHMLAGTIKTTPNFVTITGPRSMVDTIDVLYTKPVSMNLLTSNQNVNVKLVPIPQISYSTNEINIRIPVEKFTETKLQVPITAVNTPQNTELILLPRAITVKCNVIISKFFTLKPEQFNATCNFSDSDAISGSKIRVMLDKYPDYVGSVDFEPKYVDFIFKSR